jgi:hypothetical protein
VPTAQERQGIRGISPEVTWITINLKQQRSRVDSNSAWVQDTSALLNRDKRIALDVLEHWSVTTKSKVLSS